jgi:ABC-type antimicrobial peptide transport system permease subunit
VDKSQPVDRIGRIDEQSLAKLSGAPMIVGIIGSFGLFALTLAALGVFSVISYMVAERTREFGIRMALGASRSDVLRMVLGQAGVIVAVGSVVSIVGMLAVTRAAFREVADLAVTDPLLWLAVTGLLALVAIAASIVPARRATSVQPSVALRAE